MAQITGNCESIGLQRSLYMDNAADITDNNLVHINREVYKGLTAEI